jgi:hypothetical protein
VTYDTGEVFSGQRGGGIPTRPKLDLATAERELQIDRRPPDETLRYDVSAAERA